MRTLGSLVGIFIIGALAGLGEVAGIMMGMVVGGKVEILATAYVLFLAGTSAGTLLARGLFPRLRRMPVVKVVVSSAAVVAGLGGALSLSGVPMLEGDVVNIVYLAGPPVAVWIVAAVWAMASMPESAMSKVNS